MYFFQFFKMYSFQNIEKNTKIGGKITLKGQQPIFFLVLIHEQNFMR